LDLKFVSPWQFLHGSLFIDGRSSSAVTGDNWWRGAMGGKGEEFDNLGIVLASSFVALKLMTAPPWRKSVEN